MITVSFIAGHDSGSDQCIALPLPTLLLEIVFQGIKMHNQRSVFPVGPQAHVHTEHEPVGGWLADDLNELAAKAGEKIIRADRLRGTACMTGFRVSEDKIDIGGEIKLLCAQFAQTQDDQALN